MRKHGVFIWDGIEEPKVVEDWRKISIDPRSCLIVIIIRPRLIEILNRRTHDVIAAGTGSISDADMYI